MLVLTILIWNWNGDQHEIENVTTYIFSDWLTRLHYADNFDYWLDYEFESCNDRSGEGEVTCLKAKGKYSFALSASSVESVGWVLQLHSNIVHQIVDYVLLE